MRQNKTFDNLDWISILLYLLLVCIGLAFIYDTTYSSNMPNFFYTSSSHGKQFIFACLSLFIAIVILILDSKFYTSFAYILYGLIMLMLVAVLVFGVEIKGSKSWFKIGSIAFQPAELAKFATSLGLAKYISGYHVNLENLKDKSIAASIIMVPIVLILIQGDVGSALIFLSFIFLLHREGLESMYLTIGFGLIFFSLMALLFNSLVLIMCYSFILILIVYYNKKDKFPILKSIYWIVFFLLSNIGFSLLLKPSLEANMTRPYLLMVLLYSLILFIGFILKRKSKQGLQYLMYLFLAVSLFTLSVGYLFNNVLKEHHRNRINIIIGKINDPTNLGYNLEQSKIAISSGGFLGKGYLKGTQTMLNYVPEQSTDFIFTSIAEEFGFFGSFVLIGLYVIFLLRLLFLAERQRSQFSRTYAYGVVGIFFTHFAINIAMTIGLAPVIGIPLPFLSYGGSSLLSFTILLFVFLRLDTQRMLVLK